VNLSSDPRKVNLRSERRGNGLFAPNDLKIAAIARTHGLTILSADQEFSRVPGLSVEDWTQT